MSLLTERIECKELLDKLVPVEEAVRYVSDRYKIAISGFTKSGEPKTFIPALAHICANMRPKPKSVCSAGHLYPTMLKIPSPRLSVSEALTCPHPCRAG